VTAKYANHAKEEADWGFPSRIWRISRLNLFASCRRALPDLRVPAVSNRATAPRCPVSFRQQTQTWAPWGIWGTVSRVLYKQTQFGGTPATACRLGPARAGCTNKPNSAGSRRSSPYKQTQFASAGWAGEAVAGAYCAKQTQLPEAGHRGGVRRAGPPTLVDRAKQTQFGGPPGDRGADYAKQTQSCRRARGRLYKRTQFLPLCRSGDWRSREGKSCETKPNLGAPCCLGTGSRGPVQTNPISARATGRTSALWRRSYG
jgi:hypothetical protein